MLPTDKFFVPREDVLKLTSGCFEHRAVRVEEALKREKKQFFENADVQVLGTFDGSAIVLSETGKLFKVSFDETAGVVNVRGTQPVAGAVYPREAMPSYLRKESKAAADLFLNGHVEQANRKIAQLSKLVEANAIYTDDGIVDSFIRDITRTRAWKQALGEKTEAELKTVLGESFDQIDSAKLQVKFSKLYDGSLTGEELEQYRALVQEDMGRMTEKLSAVYETASKAVGQLRDLSEKMTEEQRPTVNAFISFAEDLLADLGAAKQALAETLQGADGVGALGRLFDTLAEELLRYEVAGGFVARMTTQLAQASR
jgi:hypothetical protein